MAAAFPRRLLRAGGGGRMPSLLLLRRGFASKLGAVPIEGQRPFQAGDAICWTDGACSGNPGLMGNAVVMRVPLSKIASWDVVRPEKASDLHFLQPPIPDAMPGGAGPAPVGAEDNSVTLTDLGLSLFPPQQRKAVLQSPLSQPPGGQPLHLADAAAALDPLTHAAYAVRPYLTLESSASMGHGTSNIAELQAIGDAMTLFVNAKNMGMVDPLCMHLHIFTDSQYSYNMMLGTWNAKQNLELIHGLRKQLELLTQEHAVRVHLNWLQRSTCPGNRRADELAKVASEKAP